MWRRGASQTSLSSSPVAPSSPSQMDQALRIELIHLQSTWKSSIYEFSPWEGCNEESTRAPPLIRKAKGFPLECGDQGRQIPEISELQLVDASAQKPFYSDHIRLLPHFHLLYGADEKDPVIVSCEARSDKEKNERVFLCMLFSCTQETRFVVVGRDPLKCVKEHLALEYPKLANCSKKDMAHVGMEHELFSQLCNGK